MPTRVRRLVGGNLLTRFGSADASAPSPSDPAVLPFWGSPVFREEFNYADGPWNPAKWNTRDTSDGFGLTEDAAEIEKTMAFVRGGVGHLTAEWLTTPYTRTTSKWGISQVTHRTGYVDQLDRYSTDVSFGWPFFRAEIRMKTPTGPNTRGAMPAWWYRDGPSGSFTGSHGWNGRREHDTMEAVGYGGSMTAKPGYSLLQDSAKTTYFSDTSTGAGKKQYRWRDQLGTNVVPWDGFHTYVYTVMPDYASLAVDGVQFGYWTPTDLPQLWGPSPELHPLHVRLNLHVGEYFAVPDPAHREYTQPLDFQFKYYRVWAPPP